MTDDAGIPTRLLRPKEVTRILGISYKSLLNMIHSGKIRAVRLPSGRYRIPEDEVLRIIREGREEAQ